jgi:DNA-binding CsgD family transcriptional regulator
MGHELLGSLASFLRTLAAAPHPNAVADGLVSCFHDTLAVRMAAVLPARPPLLVVFALSGYAEQDVEGFDSFHVDDDYPANRALREADVIVDPLEELPSRYAGTSRPNSRSRQMIQRLPGGWSVSAPLMSAGAAVGAYNLICDADATWGPQEIAVVGAVGNALGLWLTHPDSGLPSPDPRDRPVLTARQRRILALAAAGRTNVAIGATLGYSTSTVKQELQRAARSLGASSRANAIDRARELGLLEGVDG